MSQHNTGGRILFVDDDKSGRELSRYNLEEAGYDVDLASDGREALERFTAGRYDLVVSDLTMPGMTGLEMAEQIGSIKPSTPFILCTGNYNRLSSLQPGYIKKVVTKPFNQRKIANAVREVLQ